ncbi:sensor histidine kinase [Promicromonospora vindobonensis]|uniref:Sensor histidine kinase n=1 Tax=Promicromonospora vindobonensis TaxID=195748 RepID=A0ABW5VUX2_9MICO
MYLDERQGAPVADDATPRRWSVRQWRADLRGPDIWLRFEAFLVALPWILLLVPVLLSLVVPGPGTYGPAERIVQLALVALAGGWIYVGHTRHDPLARGRVVTVVYLAGLLTLAAVLAMQDDYFVIFVIAGFFHAYYLAHHPRSWTAVTAGVLATSLVINLVTINPEPTLRSIGMIVLIVVVQTVAISGGYVLSVRGMEQQREQQRAVTRLELALAENESLHTRLVDRAREAGVADERRRLAGEIHDTLAQGLTGIVTQVQAAQRVWHDPDRARPHVDRALDLARDSLAEARRSVRSMHPGELVSSRLPEALADLTRRWAADHGVLCSCDITGEAVPLPPATEVALFRAAQESLTNVARHAAAGRVGVTLSYLDDTVLLDVRDDGSGFVPDATTPTFGLTAMRERLAGVGGTLVVESTPGEGAAISASVPVGKAAVAGAAVRSGAPGSGDTAGTTGRGRA